MGAALGGLIPICIIKMTDGECARIARRDARQGRRDANPTWHPSLARTTVILNLRFGIRCMLRGAESGGRK